MRLFLRIFSIIFPILLLFSLFRSFNGNEPLTFSYFLNTLSNFKFGFTETKEVLYLAYDGFKYVFIEYEVTGLFSFFEWLSLVFYSLIIKPVNIIFALCRDIFKTLNSIFNVIFMLLGLQ